MNKDIYRRYFEIKDADTLARIAELQSARMAYNKAALEFIKEIGAKNASTRNERISGFEFNDTPDLTIWKDGRDGWVPRLNTNGGKSMRARMDALNDRHKPEPLANALTIAGLITGCPAVFDAGGGVAYLVGVCGFSGDNSRWFASVPWFDEDPAKLAEYKAQRADEETRTHWSSELDHLCWEAPAEWVEVREWEVQKALDEHNAANRAESG